MIQYLILLAPSFACLFGGITLLCKLGKNYQVQNILAINLLITSVTFFIYANTFTSEYNNPARYKEEIIFAFSALSMYPLYIFYLKLLTDEHKFSKWNYLWLAPTLIVGGGTWGGYILLGKEGSLAYAREIRYNYGEKDTTASFTKRVYS